MSIFSEQIESIQHQLKVIANIESLQQSEQYGHAESEMISMMLEQASRFSEENLVELAEKGDIQGCRLDNGKVKLPEGTVDVYQQWCELGFPALGIPMENDGMGFPLVALSAIQEVTDGANLGFGMLTINLRCAALALIANASDEIKQRWLPGLISGEIASTIAISEPQAGSDAGRIRTSASMNDSGDWIINGGKIWISFADHDATEQILHLVLARIPGGDIGTRGLGLFIVPKILEDKDDGTNGVIISRLEHKMGLHNSPTCVMELENSRAFLIGEADQGIQNLFVMMNAMRLAVAIQGSAVANAATLHAIHYAKERPQGGRPDQAPLMISSHPDVKRMLLEMTAESELIRALAFKTASYLDLAETQTGEQQHHYKQLGELLLPVAKTVCSETAFTVASQAIQVMGGYGYTNDYPVERMLRDIRVSSIYEGTSGIQSLDFIKRKVIADKGELLSSLLEIIESDVARLPNLSSYNDTLLSCLEKYRQNLQALLKAAEKDKNSVLGGAYDFLNLTALLMHGFHSLVLVSQAGDSAMQQRLKAALELYLHHYQTKFDYFASRSRQAVSDYTF